MKGLSDVVKLNQRIIVPEKSTNLQYDYCAGNLTIKQLQRMSRICRFISIGMRGTPQCSFAVLKAHAIFCYAPARCVAASSCVSFPVSPFCTHPSIYNARLLHSSHESMQLPISRQEPPHPC
jgi:hypothetical protein